MALNGTFMPENAWQFAKSYLKLNLHLPTHIFHHVLSYHKIQLSHVNQLVRNKLVQGIKKHSSATSKPAVEEATYSEISENHDNLEITKTAKERAAPCISPHNDASLRNINDPGYRHEIYEDNGTFFRKLNSTSIHPTGISLCLSRGFFGKCLRF